MTDTTTEQLLKEQADAVLKIQQEALSTQMKMMESLYGNNPEMLAMMKAQLEQSLANQSQLVGQAQAAALQAMGQAQAGQFDPNAFVASMQAQAQDLGYAAEGGEDDVEGFDNALRYIGQLETDFTEREAVTLKAGSPEARVFGYLLGGIVGVLNDHQLTTLAPEPDTEDAHETVRGILENYWGVESTQDLGERLGDLLEEGGHAALYAHYAEVERFEDLEGDIEPEDRAGERARWRFARHLAASCPPEKLRGWDIGRAACLARWGAFEGLIDEETAEDVLELCAREACARFAGWREFAVSYLTGGLFWRLNAGEDAAADWLDNAASACATLLDADDPGAWYAHPWAREIVD